MKVAVCGSGAYYSRGVAYLKEYGYELAEIASPEDAEKDTEVLVCLAYPKILKPKILKRFPKGCINFHCGLPNYRGRHPLQWMLIDGVKRIPCAVHYMTKGVDEGDIIEDTSFPVDRNETYATALAKVLDQVGPLLIAALYNIENDKVVRKPQGVGRYWPPRTPADSRINFNQPSAVVHRFINAMSDPMPNAFDGNGQKYTRSYLSEPGQICYNGPTEFFVATSDGFVKVEAIVRDISQ